MSKKILITGGAGFIGSHFIKYLLKHYPNYKIKNLDRLTYAGNLDNLREVQKNPHYEFIKGDIKDKKIVKKALLDCDVIVNFAATTHVDRSIRSPEEFLRTNIYGAYVLLEEARKKGIELFIQISTDEVYGPRLRGYAKEIDYFSPSSPYAASKASADCLVNAYKITYNLPTIICRPSNNFGPYQYPEKIIPFFIILALYNRPLPLYGDGRYKRDWIYVLDTCRAIDLIFHKGEKGHIYNISAGNERTNIELAKLILDILNKPKNLINYVSDRPGHDRRYALSTKHIKELGWRPKYEFFKMLQKTIYWYKNNVWWWRKLIKL